MKKILILGMTALMLLLMTGLAAADFAITRDLPESADTNTVIDVTVSFTPDEDLVAVGLADTAPSEFDVSVDTDWCTPEADLDNLEDTTAQYIWYELDSGTAITGIYSIDLTGVPAGTYTFTGYLSYRTPDEVEHEVAVGGDYELVVVGEQLPEVVINEFSSYNASGDWIELYNKGTGQVFLDGWSINDSDSEIYTFTTGDNISAGGYLVVNAGNRLNRDGDAIILLNGSVIVDQVTYGPGADKAPAPGEGNSTGRYPNGVDTDNDAADFKEFGTPTPGESNGVPEDITPPEIINPQPADGSFINDATPTISANYGDLESGINVNSVEMRVDGGIVTPDSISETGVSYTPTVPLEEGSHTVNVTVSDNAANSNSISWSFMVDTILPTIQFIEPPTPENNTEVNVNYVNVSVNVTDPAPSSGIDNMTVKLVWNETEESMTVYMYAFSEGKYFCNLTDLPNGGYTYWVQANDTAGNMNVSETRVVTVNKSAIELMEGDVTMDMHVTMADAMFIAQYKAGTRSLNESQLKCADTTDEGDVTMADAMHIAQWKADPYGTLGVLYKPLWESPADDNMLKPVDT